MKRSTLILLLVFISAQLFAALKSNTIYYRLVQVNKDTNATISLSSNSFSDTLRLTIGSQIDQPCYVSITNIAGHHVENGMHNIIEGVNIINYNTGSWPHDLYFIKVRFEDGTTTTLKAVK